MAGAGAVRQAIAKRCFGRRSVGGVADLAAVGIARAAGARGADAFRGADRQQASDRLRSRAGADHCGPIAGIVRAQYPSLDRQRRGAAGARIIVARAPPGAGDTRPARVLARQLCRGPFRSARTLSAPSLAGGPRECAAHTPGQTAWNVRRVNTSVILFLKMAGSAGAV